MNSEWPGLGSRSAGEQRPWVQRHGFPEWLMALMWIVIAFFVFQTVGPLVFLALLFASRNVSIETLDINALIQGHIDLLFWGNSSGQILVILLGTLWILRLHSNPKERSQYIRWIKEPRSQIINYSLLAGLLIILLQPTIWFLGWVNSLLPFPESYLQMEQAQIKVLQDYLAGNQWLGMTLLHVALVPAICEEVLFRGYVLRAVERSGTIGMGILVSGLLFGFFHLRLTQVIPLSVIGIILAVITWKSRSLIPAMVAHLINNAGGILLIAFFPDSSFMEVNPESAPPIWLLVISVGSGVGLFWYIYHLSSLDKAASSTDVAEAS
jgi:membrane protease YdiL (CAAX protease family)